MTLKVGLELTLHGILKKNIFKHQDSLQGLNVWVK
jgi:hypothetical protein